jgi:pyridoxine 4-dehydrogenase
LTGQLLMYEDMAEDDARRHMPRFQPENFDANLKLVEEVEEVAKKKGCTVSQVAIGWISAMSGRDDNLPTIIPIPGATTVLRVNENLKQVKLGDSDMKELDDALSKINVQGERYGGKLAEMVDG